MFGEAKLKKSKSKQSNGSANLVEENINTFETKVGGTAAKSDHGDNKVGFFENIKRHIAKLGRKDTRS